MKFDVPCWPVDLHGMIMVDDSFLLPEVWFRVVPDEVQPGQPTAYAVGFTTAKYAERVAGMTQQEVSKTGWQLDYDHVHDLDQVYSCCVPES
jgi:hypothetical protein